jgi:hypothetical protein
VGHDFKRFSRDRATWGSAGVCGGSCPISCPSDLQIPTWQSAAPPNPTRQPATRFLDFGPSGRLTLPLAGLAPTSGVEALTTRGGRRLPLRGTWPAVPSLQTAAVSAALACVSDLPASFGTMQAGSGSSPPSVGSPPPPPGIPEDRESSSKLRLMRTSVPSGVGAVAANRGRHIAVREIQQLHRRVTAFLTARFAVLQRCNYLPDPVRRRGRRGVRLSPPPGRSSIRIPSSTPAPGWDSLEATGSSRYG